MLGTVSGNPESWPWTPGSALQNAPVRALAVQQAQAQSPRSYRAGLEECRRFQAVSVPAVPRARWSAAPAALVAAMGVGGCGRERITKIQLMLDLTCLQPLARRALHAENLTQSAHGKGACGKAACGKQQRDTYDRVHLTDCGPAVRAPSAPLAQEPGPGLHAKQT